MKNCSSIRSLGSQVLLLVFVTLVSAPPAHGGAAFARKITFLPDTIDSGFLLPYETVSGGVGYGLTATGGTGGTTDILIRYNNSGVETGNAELVTDASSSQSGLIGIPDVPGRFHASYVHDTGYADIGLFNFSDLSSVFSRRLTLTTSSADASLTHFSNNRIGVIQDGGTSIIVTLFDATTGNLAFEQTYTSPAFIVAGGTSGQTANLSLLPDNSGYVLAVSNYQLDLGGGGVAYSNSIVIAYLSTTGTVLATTRLQMTSGSPVFAVPSVLPDNSVLINVLDQSVDPMTFEVTSQNVLFNIRSNGTLKWAKIYSGAILFGAQSETSSGDLYLSGYRDTSSGQSTTSDGVFARISSTDGSLVNQANVDLGASDSVSISGFSSNAVFATATVAGNSPGTSRVTLLKLPLNLGAVSTAVDYDRDVYFAFPIPVAANAELILTTFENSQDVGVITLTENFGATLNCALLTPVVVPVTNPGITTANSAVTPVAVVVNAAASVPVTGAASFSLSHVVATTSDICTVTAAAPVINSALTATGTVGAAFTYTITATNSPTSCNNATGLPAGLLVNTSTGAITGTPTTAAVTNVTISATNGAGTGQATLQVTINPATPTAPAITTHPANQTVTAPALATFTVAATGTPSTFTYTWQRKPAGSATFGNLSNGGSYSAVSTATLTVDPTAADMSGDQFRCVVGNTMAPDATSNAATLTVNASTARLINLSVRTGAGTGSQTLIVGFVVGGSGTKQVLVRGIGPTLGSFGVAGVLADPQLRIYSGNTLLQENDDWGGGAALTNAFSSVFAFGLAADSKDSAMLATFDSGSYTSHCSSTAGTGIALVELYDMLAPGSTAQLVNVSARTQVETGDGILIAGFVIDGTTSKTLLIRGIGPTLGDFGVGGVLADPQLAVYSGNTVVQSNDNWGGTAQLNTAFGAVFAFGLPADSKDAAVLVTLAPGTYTAQVSGVGAATGVALVEVYAMP